MTSRQQAIYFRSVMFPNKRKRSVLVLKTLQAITIIACTAVFS